MSRFTKRAACFLAAVCAFIFSAVGYFDVTLPDSFYVSGDDLPQIGSALSLSVSIDSAAPAVSDGDIDSEASVMLFGAIPIKKAEIKHTKTPYLVPGGSPIGIKLLTDGVVVVATEDSSGRKGPAADAGIEAGDTIISANGEVLSSSNRLAEIIMNSHGEKISLLVRRDGKEFPASVTPEFSDSEGTYKAGLWIKDSSAGVGTLTYTDPSSGSFGALGHPISDGDTGKILPLGSGEIVDVTVTGCDKGRPGRPGELIGTFLSGLACGTIKKRARDFRQAELFRRVARTDPDSIQNRDRTRPGGDTGDGGRKHAEGVQREYRESSARVAGYQEYGNKSDRSRAFKGDRRDSSGDERQPDNTERKAVRSSNACVCERSEHGVRDFY